jgi:hypothetical protein
VADLIYVAVVVGFFVLTAGYVTACDRIIGADPDDLVEGGEEDPEEGRDRDRAQGPGAEAVTA